MDLFFSHFHTPVAALDRIPVVISAFLLSGLFGIVYGARGGISNPLIWNVIDGIFGRTGDRLDRLHRPRPDLMFRGFLMEALVLFIVLWITSFIEKTIITMTYYKLFESVLLAFCLTSGAVWVAVWRLYHAQERKKPSAGAFYAISRSTRTNLSVTDDYTIARKAMGLLPRSFDKGLIAPVFWYLVGGLPAAAGYAALACLAWRFGKDGFTKGFGTIPLVLEEVFGLIPSILTSVLMALATIFTPTASIFRGFRAFLGVKGRAPYWQGGLPLSVLAWGLNVSLGGASQDLSGSAIKGAWVGPPKATAKNDHQHLKRALYMIITCHLLMIVALSATYLWALKSP